jgi:hypothetical protein
VDCLECAAHKKQSTNIWLSTPYDHILFVLSQNDAPTGFSHRYGGSGWKYIAFIVWATDTKKVHTISYPASVPSDEKWQRASTRLPASAPTSCRCLLLSSESRSDGCCLVVGPHSITSEKVPLLDPPMSAPEEYAALSPFMPNLAGWLGAMRTRWNVTWIAHGSAIASSLPGFQPHHPRCHGID